MIFARSKPVNTFSIKLVDQVTFPLAADCNANFRVLRSGRLCAVQLFTVCNSVTLLRFKKLSGIWTVQPV